MPSRKISELPVKSSPILTDKVLLSGDQLAEIGTLPASAASVATAIETMTSNQSRMSRVGLNKGLTLLTDAASIVTDCALNDRFMVTLGGNRSLANPTNVQAGAVYEWIIKQDATGGRTLTLGANFKLASGETWATGGAANGIDILSAVAVDASTLLVSFRVGY